MNTSNVRPLHANRDVSRDPLSLPPQRTGQTNQSLTKSPFVAKGHDRQLKAAQDNGFDVEVDTMTELHLKGRIVQRDRYTITLAEPNGDERIIFKHGIESMVIRGRTTRALALAASSEDQAAA